MKPNPLDRVYVTPSPVPWFYIQLDHLNIHSDVTATRIVVNLASHQFNVVLCPLHAHLPATNGLVNEVEYPKLVKTNEIARSVIIT